MSFTERVARLLTILPANDVVAFVRSAELALFPLAAPRDTATFWLELTEDTPRELPPGVPASEGVQQRLEYFKVRSQVGLKRLTERGEDLLKHHEGLAEAYNLEEAVLSDDEQPFTQAYAKLLILMEEYISGQDVTLEGVKRGERPRRPKPAAHPAEMLRQARKDLEFRSGHRALRSIHQIDRVISEMACFMIQPR